MNEQVKTYPNQKVIRVKKEVCDKQHTYALMQKAAFNNASKDLKAGAMVLWTYIALNQDDYEFALSNKAVLDAIGMKKTQYDNAVEELEQKGYLEKIQGNKYFFYENPKVRKPNKEETISDKSQETSLLKSQENQLLKVRKPNKQKSGKLIRNNIYNNTNDTKGSKNFLATLENFSHGVPPAEPNEDKGTKAKQVWQALPPRTDETVQLLKQYAEAGIDCVSSEYTFDNLLDYFTIEQLQQSIATVDYLKRVLIEPDGTAAVIILKEDNSFGF